MSRDMIVRLNHQHQQESMDTKKEPTLMIECTANEGIHRINMEINHTKGKTKKIYVRPTVYEVKHATCKRKKKCKQTQIKLKQTVIQRNGIHMDTADGLVIDTPGTKTFTLVKIKDRFPDEWNGRSPIYYMTTNGIFYKVRRIDDRYPDEWNGRSSIYYMITKQMIYKVRGIDDRYPDEWNGRSPIGHE